MKLAVFSHKICWPDQTSPTGYTTDGGFPFHMRAISQIFEQTAVVVPIRYDSKGQGAPLDGRGMKIVPLTLPSGKGMRRKLSMMPWLLRNGVAIVREVSRADAVHAPIPGDIGTIGMLVAFAMRKPLFVRHCGNWLEPRTAAERFWRWFMERFAGNRNVMLATGGAAEPPSRTNSYVRWIFSSSLWRKDLEGRAPRHVCAGDPVRLVIVCRQEAPKGTGTAIRSLALLL